MAVVNTPPIDRLLAQLQITGLAVKDPALFQVIDLIIKWMRQFQLQVTGTSSGSGGGGGGGLLNQSFITVNNDTATLPNSFQLIAGDNITFTFGTNTLTISANVPAPIINTTNIFQIPFEVAELDLNIMRKNGRTSIYRRFTSEQVGAPIIMVQQPGKDSDMSLVTFAAEVISTRTMHVFWQALNGAPSKVKVNYLIGESDGND